jgi:hypothetical protein
MIKTVKGSSFLFNTFIVMVCIVLSACSPAAELKIINSSLTAREFTSNANAKQSMAAVTGQVKNMSQSAVLNCKIKVVFYDNDKNVIGESAANRESLLSGEIWNFTVQLTNADAWKTRSYDIFIVSN